ncbi:alpha/beta hydrolase family protein [Pontimicrobium sp. MEBiC06410]
MIRFIFKIIIPSLIFIVSAIAQNTPRPQDPKLPLSYKSETVYFTNPKANNIKLAGTLTLPNNRKKPTVAILISGSGAQDRDANLKAFNHRPFLVLSDYLTRHGIAVLRYDDRGTAESEGNHGTATSADFATDVEAAIAYLKTRDDIDPSKIGLIGHSEGGLIAPMVASNTKDVAFAVLIAGTGVNGATVLETQSRKAAELQGIPKAQLNENEKLTSIIYEAILTYKDNAKITDVITKGLNDYKANNPESMLAPMITPQMINQQLSILNSKWLMYFIRSEPHDFLSKTTCPVLAINGSKDIQVLPKLNLEGIRKGLEAAGNKDYTIKEIAGLNHLMQTANTGSIQEYGTIEETHAPASLKLITDWINKRF